MTLIDHSTVLVARLLAVVMFTPILAIPGVRIYPSELIRLRVTETHL
jgi:hypothetical protein